MKIIWCTDLHYGSRGGNIAFHEYFRKFYDEIFFPYLEKNKIHTVVLGGDIVEHRKSINFWALNQLRTVVMDRLRDMGIEVHCIVGNHDLYYKSTSDLNAMTELFGDYENVTIHSEPTKVNFGNLTVDMMPWIHNGNYEQCMEFIKKSDSKVLMGHLELQGFKMYKNHVSNTGLDRITFDDYKMVISGHYHHKSTDGHVFYTGNPYEITWSDAGDERGFFVLDTKTLDFDFIENPHKMFYQLTYDNGCIDDIDFNCLENRMVKLVVKNKTDLEDFDNIVASIQKVSPLNFTIIDQNSSIEEVDEAIETEDTFTIVNKHIDSNYEDEDLNNSLKALFKELHDEAVNSV